MPRKNGFIFTMDALFSLAALALLSIAFAGLASTKPEMQRYSGLDTEGRDYLQLVYLKGYNTTAEEFRNWTGHTLYGATGTKIWTFGPPDYLTTDWHELPSSDPRWNNVTLVGSGEVYKHDKSAGINETEQTYAGDPQWYDYQVSSKIQFTTATGNEAVGGISARANASGARYTCMAYHNKKLILWKNADWTTSMPWPAHNELDSIGIGTTANQWYLITMTLSGNRVNCTMVDNGGAKTLLYDDLTNPFLKGMIGLDGTQDALTYFDNVTVKPVPVPLPDGLNFALRAGMILYPNVCACDPLKTTSCTLGKTNDCLQGQQNITDRANITKEVWVA